MVAKNIEIDCYLYTIIIPHYDIPSLLVRCLNSIPIRDYIQVIVVDDCSPNAERYIKLYPELSRPYLEFYSTTIGGSAGRARNVGLDHAKGKWIICIDADDFFVNNMEEILLESKNRNEDVLYFNYISVFNDNINLEAHRTYFNSYFRSSKNKESLFRYHFDPMWGKIFKRELIEKFHIRCDECRYGNDVAFSFKCGVYANEIAIIDKPLFIITQREDSLSSSDFSNKKISSSECKIRLEGGLRIKQFIIDNRLNIKKNSYIQRALIFLNEYPLDFLKFYYNFILKKHSMIGLKLPFQMFYYGIKKLLYQMVRPIYRIFFKRNTQTL